MKRVGYWISEKKSKKLNFEDQRTLFRNAGFELVKIDLTRPLEDQGPFDVIVHKISDILAKASEGYITAQKHIDNIEGYLSRHPECVIIDPLDSTRKLLDRNEQYKLVLNCDLVSLDYQFFTPPFVELDTTDVDANRKKLTQANVTYPFVCKPIQAHGSKMAHQMAIIFNQESLVDVSPPCVAQSFINHNAVLYKIFVIGRRQFIVHRPSLKNLYPSDQPTIFFDTQEVSKSDSTHFLNELDASDVASSPMLPDTDKLFALGHSIRQSLDMDLFGIDVIIDSETKRHAVIDINAFPGYDGVDSFFQYLIDHITERLQERDGRHTGNTLTTCVSEVTENSKDVTRLWNPCSEASFTPCNKSGLYKHSMAFSESVNGVTQHIGASPHGLDSVQDVCSKSSSHSNDSVNGASSHGH